MSIYSQFKTNKNCEENGITIRFAANEDGTIPSFKIARACRSNKKWAVAFEAASRKFKKEIADRTVTEEESQIVTVETFCKALLIGWDNIQGADGKPIVFSVENAIKLFTELPELFDILYTKAHDFTNFLEADVKVAEKN